MNEEKRTTLALGLKSSSGKDFSASQLVGTPPCSFSSSTNYYCPTYNSSSFGVSILDHVAMYSKTNESAAPSTLSSSPNFSSMEQRGNQNKSFVVNHSSHLIDNQLPLDKIHNSEKFAENFVPHQFQNPTFSGIPIAKTIVPQPKATNFEPTSPKIAVNQDSNINYRTSGTEQDTDHILHVSAFLPDEFVFYDNNNQSDDAQETFVEENFSQYKACCENYFDISRQINEAVIIPGLSKTPESLDPSREKSSEVKAPELNKSSEISISPVSSQETTIISGTQNSSISGSGKTFDSNSSKSFLSASPDAVKEKLTDANNSSPFLSKRNRHAFKKLTPTAVIEEYLSNSENMSYDELYRRTAEVASLMTQLQDEARIIDKELSDFEIVRKSEQQIAAEELRLEKEQQQREDDAIFEMLLQRYGTFTRSSIEEWTEFHEKFYESNLEKNPDHCRIILFLRNPQFISDFHKRTAAKQRAELKAHTFRLTNTVDSPPSKAEQRATEESDRKKRKPAIDPLVFDDRKMADVYGITYKAGDAFIGNQPLRNLYENLKDASSASGVDDNSRPKRARGRRNNCDYDQSDHTPVVSDADDNFRAKRTRTAKFNNDKAAPSRPITKNLSPGGSRESTPVAGPKVFASGKRVGRPPGSKTQVKLPSKLKSVQAAGEIVEGNRDDKSQSPGSAKGKNPLQISENPVALIEESVQVPEKNPVKKHAGGRPRKKKLVIQGMSNLSPNPKSKAGKSRKYPILKTAEESKTIDESNLKIKLSQSSKALVALKYDQDVLPSTEIEEIVEFPSFPSSRPTSSSSANTSSAIDRCDTYSASRAVEPLTAQVSPAQTRRAKRKCTGASEFTFESYETILKKKDKDVAADPLALTNVILPFEDNSGSAPPKKAVRVTLRHTPRAASDPRIKFETSNNKFHDTTLPQFPVPVEKVSASNQQGLKNSYIFKGTLVTAQPGQIDSRNSSIMENQPELLYRQNPNLNPAKNQVSYITGVLEKEPEATNGLYSTLQSATKKENKVPIAIYHSLDAAGVSMGKFLAENTFATEAAPTRTSRIMSYDNLPGSGRFPINGESFQKKDILCQLKKTESCPYREPYNTRGTGFGGENKDVFFHNEEASSGIRGAMSASRDKNLKSIPTSDRYSTPLESAQASASSSALLSPASAPSTINRPPLVLQLAISGLSKSNCPQFLSKGLQDFDGARDEEPIQPREQFLSEYERYQVLTSPASLFNLGKRQRRSRVDLSLFEDDFQEEL